MAWGNLFFFYFCKHWITFHSRQECFRQFNLDQAFSFYGFFFFRFLLRFEIVYTWLAHFFLFNSDHVLYYYIYIWNGEITVVHGRIIVSRWETAFIFPFLITELTVDLPKSFVACVVCTCIFAKKYVSQIWKKKMFFSSQVLKEKKNNKLVSFFSFLSHYTESNLILNHMQCMTVKGDRLIRSPQVFAMTIWIRISFMQIYHVRGEEEYKNFLFWKLRDCSRIASIVSWQ